MIGQAAAGWEWINDFLTLPHPQIGRSGPVCPFVMPAIKNGTLHFDTRRISPAADAGHLAALIEDLVDEFTTMAWVQPNKTLHAMVVVIVGLSPERTSALDEAHAMVKHRMVRRGLMLGQFHPDCTETAARNPSFAVARSPVPMLALRNMAFHDLLFLHQDRDWFTAYAGRYGRRYEIGQARDLLLTTLYEQACQRWRTPS
ncbi:DUF6875 domain-containing protein [Streptosporangium sp. NPDC051023]|uniref:DUF6875 domain-containing protein n=1 Tax=Streptosporangium sp. NPDC051023 TaxID=3155410 RepID=UPI00344EAE7E